MKQNYVAISVTRFSLYHILTLPTTKHGVPRFGLTTTKDLWRCSELDLQRGKISEVLRSGISVATEKPRRCLQACDVFAEKPKAVENMKIQGANKTSAMLLILGISVGRDKLLILGIGKGRDKMVKKSKVMSGCYKRCIIFFTLFF